MGARMIAVNPMIYRIYSRFQAFSLGGPSGPSFFFIIFSDGDGPKRKISRKGPCKSKIFGQFN